MADFKIHKVVSALPGTLAPDAVYAVRSGVGFDLYVSDATGSTAHKINAPDARQFLQAQGAVNGMFRNGSCQDGTNAGFSAFVYDAVNRPFGANGSFKRTNYGVMVSDDFMPVDPFAYYELGCSAIQLVKVSAAPKFFAGLVQYDRDGLEIQAVHSMRQAAGDTVLTQDLSPGDTVVHLNNVAGWPNTAVPYYQRGFIFFNYQDSSGYVYERSKNPYSRHFAWGSAGNELWAPGAVDAENGYITLAAPWAYANPLRGDGKWLAGTEVSPTNSGGSFNYRLTPVAVDLPTTNWASFRAYLGGGFGIAGTQDDTKFRPGCQKIKFLVLANHSLSVGDVMCVGNIHVSRLADALGLTTQALLVNQQNIKSVGGVSLLGSGDIPLPSGGGSTDLTVALASLGGF